jgi:hypothetical protein
MARLLLHVLPSPLLVLVMTAAGLLAVTAGCQSPVIHRPAVPGPRLGLLRSETETKAFREAVRKDNGIPTASQAGVASAK